MGLRRLSALPASVLICVLATCPGPAGTAPSCTGVHGDDNVVLLQSAKVVRVAAGGGHLVPEDTKEPASKNATASAVEWSDPVAVMGFASDRVRHRFLKLFQQLAGAERSSSKTAAKAPQWSTVDIDIIIAALVFLMPILCFVVMQEVNITAPRIRMPDLSNVNLPHMHMPHLSGLNLPGLPGLGPRLAYARAGLTGGGDGFQQHQADHAGGGRAAAGCAGGDGGNKIPGRKTILDGAAALRAYQSMPQPSFAPAPPPNLAAAGWPGAVEADVFGTYLILQDAVPVSAGVGLTTSVVASLSVGEAVTVQEVQWAGDTGHLRGRLKYPDGWISLVNVQDGRQWAVKRTAGPIVMDGLLDGSKVGLSLNQDLVVTRVVDDRAVHHGWCIGDTVLQVNGVPVKGEAGFMDEIHRAAVAWRTTGVPISFDIARAQPIECEAPGHDSPHQHPPTRKPSPKSTKKASC